MVFNANKVSVGWWALMDGMVWYSSVQRPTRHIIGHFGDDFTGQTTQPTVS